MSIVALIHVTPALLTIDTLQTFIDALIAQLTRDFGKGSHGVLHGNAEASIHIKRDTETTFTIQRTRDRVFEVRCDSDNNKDRAFALDMLSVALAQNKHVVTVNWLRPVDNLGL